MQLSILALPDRLEIRNLVADCPLLLNNIETDLASAAIGDCLQIGPHQLRVVECQAGAILEGRTHGYLNRRWGIPVNPTLPYRIGRGPRRFNDLDLNSSNVSRVQACITCAENGYVIEAESSKSATLVNGTALPCGSRLPLQDGDLVVFGDIEFRYSILEPAPPGTPQLRFGFFGGAQVHWAGQKIANQAFKGNLALFLLGFIASKWPRPTPIDSILEQFWPEVEGDKARNNLKNSLWVIRKALSGEVPNSQSSSAPPPLLRQAHTVEIHPGLEFSSDLVDLNNCLRQDPPGPEVFSIYRGAFFEECPMEWAQHLKADLATRLSAVGSAMILRARTTGDWGRMVEVARACLIIDPSDQQAMTALIFGLRNDGRAQEAVTSFARFEKTLQLRLGVTPNVELLREFQEARLQL